MIPLSGAFVRLNAALLGLSLLLPLSSLHAGCDYSGQNFSEGAERCGPDGRIQNCANGAWHSTVRACSSKKESRKKSSKKKKKSPIKVSRGVGKWSPD
jgi:hypothetical protein